ncbi:MAG: replication-associated recombination protein A [Patescibacteria group bacterium]
MDLFDSALALPSPNTPLAERMRPKTLEEFEGQQEVVGPGTPLHTAVINDEVPSLMLWGPPGTGKTTLARIIANMTKARFVPFSAVGGSVKDVREIILQAENDRKYYKRKTILFVDEIHRFNKAQQDAFLPSVENGTITLIGATTENPSFAVNGALLSRSRVIVLKQLEPESIVSILKRAINDKELGLGKENVTIENDALELLANFSSGDARSALNTLDLAVKTATSPSPSLVRRGNATEPESLPLTKGELEEVSVTSDMIKTALAKSHLQYDKTGEEHYNIISALHKSMRGNDANAALYWMGLMLLAGEDPLYITRRLIRFASEDIGLADPNALLQALAAHQAVQSIGMPECSVNIAQCVAYLSKAPKSNALYTAWHNVERDIQELPNEPVPIHLRNAPTKLMKDLGYGKDYKYTPSFKNTEDAKQDYLPKRLKNKKYLP